PVLAGERENAVHVTHVAIGVDWNDQPGAGRNAWLDLARGHAPSVRVDLGTNGSGAEVQGDVRGGQAAESRDDDLVSVPESERQISHVQRCGAVRRSYGIPRAAVAPEVLLESVDKGAARNPRGPKGFDQVCLLGTEEGRLGVGNLQGCGHRELVAWESGASVSRQSKGTAMSRDPPAKC